MSKILVTGAAGFMGSHLVDALLAEGHTVIGIDDFSGGYPRNLPHPNTIDWGFYNLDLSEERAIDIISKMEIDVLFHLAADATEGRSQFTPVNCTKRNFMAYMNTLTGAIKAGVKKVVLVSSMSVYGDQEPPFHEDLPRIPADVYAVNKTAMERSTEILSVVHGFEYTIIRPHNVFGARQNIADPYRNVVGIFMNRIMRGEPPLIYGDGEQTRAFTYIENFTPYLVKAGAIGSFHGEIINIGPTEEYSINHLAKCVLKAFNSDLKPTYYPDRPLEVKHAFCTVDKAKRLLGYETTVSFEEGIERMSKWAMELGPQPLNYINLELVNEKTPKTWSKKEM